MGRAHWKHVSVKKLPVKKRPVKKDSGFSCPYDVSACSKPEEYFDRNTKTFFSGGDCFSLSLKGKVSHVCSRFKGKLPDASVLRDSVREALAEDSIPK
jgi:hypothetical protein